MTTQRKSSSISNCHDQQQPNTNNNEHQLTWSCHTAGRLIQKSLFSMVAESSFHVALFIETALIARILGSDSLAVYGAVCAIITLINGLVNFSLVITLSQVGLAVGAKRWHEIGPRFRIALSAALYLGCICVLIVFFSKSFIFGRLMPLGGGGGGGGEDDESDSDGLDLRAEALSVISVRVLVIPFMLVQKVCNGFLGGYQRIKTMACFSALLGITEVVSQVIALIILDDGGLVAASVGSVVTAALGAVLCLILVAVMPPEQAKGRIQLVPPEWSGSGSSFSSGGCLLRLLGGGRRSGSTSGGNPDGDYVDADADADTDGDTDDSKKKMKLMDSTNSNPPNVNHSTSNNNTNNTQTTQTAQTATTTAPGPGPGLLRLRDIFTFSFLSTPSARDYFKASSNTFIRSLMISGCVFSATVIISNFGSTSLLAAHKVAHDLWHTMAFVVDGLATVGNMKGSKLIGSLSSSSSTSTSSSSSASSTTSAASAVVADKEKDNKEEGGEKNKKMEAAAPVELRAFRQEQQQQQQQQQQDVVSSAAARKQIFVLRDMLTLFGIIVGALAGLGMMVYRDNILAYLFPTTASWLFDHQGHGHNDRSSSSWINYMFDFNNAVRSAASTTTSTSPSSSPPSQHHHSTTSPSSLSSSHHHHHHHNYKHEMRTVSFLLPIWPVISLMQIVNSIVFVFDGLMYAAQAFRYIRNNMMVAVLGWYVPMIMYLLVPMLPSSSTTTSTSSPLSHHHDHHHQSSAPHHQHHHQHQHQQYDHHEQHHHHHQYSDDGGGNGNTLFFGILPFPQSPLTILWLVMAGVSCIRMFGGFALLYINLPKRWGSL